MKRIEEIDYTLGARTLIDASRNRICVLDGAMGTMIQRQGLDEDGFRGREFASHPRQLKGCNDLLVLTQPALIEQIHRQYLDAGADIIETDSFNANAFSLADYGLEGLVERINRAAATVARRAADAAMAATHGRRCWVAGSMGPTSKSLSMAADLDAGADTSTTATFDALVATYTDQAYALIDGGVDALLVETVFDGLNAKAAVYACRRAMEKAMRRVPIMVSATLTESSRTLSGQTVEALVASVAHAEPLSVGLNCGFGTDGMVPYLDRLQPMPYAVSLYPNAGLPNALGEYEETPQTMAAKLRPLLRAGLINIVGGCCGTTPEHIAAIAAEVATAVPRSIPASTGGLTLAGLEAYTIDADGFTAIGERCNVAGSRKFLRLINQGSLDEAITIARKQVDDGAMVVDINMDDAMLDAPTEMGRFVSRIAVEPEVSRVPLMIDSSNPDAIMAGLKSAQGRPIVNSISLKGGEAQFLEMARTIHELGAAMVVMAFDEQGQAASYERKVEVCRRAYRLLTTEAGIPASDIIFDPNVLTVATGIDAHRRYAIDFIEAVRTIRRECPGAHCSGGVSNLSFALRGNNYVREAMHSLFLAHARKAGLDMAIINPSTAIAPDTIAPDLTEAIDDVLLDRRDDATDRLVDLAAAIMEAKSAAKGSVTQVATDTATASQRLEEMVVKGLTDGMETLLSEVLATVGSAMAVIEGPLMSGMNRVGELFGAGRMFLPQVVKTARAMKHAVAWLTPHIEAEKATAGGAAAKMVIATVKGDVHDIGKNIVSVIMNCNGFDVVDLGVMVPGEDIVDCAVAEKADFVALSGLITPSLNEMCHVAQLMEERGLKIPLLIGGATTSDVHTAVKIAPCYSGPVAYTRDAAMMPEVARRFMADKDAATDELRAHQEQLRMRHSGGNAIRLLSAAEARQRRYPYGDIATPAPLQCGMHTMQVSIAQARKAINKRAFLTAWGLPASAATATHAPTCTCGCHASTTPTATELLADAERALDRLSADGMTIAARVVLTAAASDDSDNIIYRDPTTGTITLLPTLRQQHADDVDGNHYRLSLSDYLMPVAADGSLPDHIGLFAVTCGHYIPSLVENYRAAGDEYHALLYQLLADRLVEAATEVLHRYVRTNLWGYSPDESAPEDGAPLRQYYQGIRPAVGYPSLPDQSLLRLTGATLNISELGIVLTENCAMSPAATTSGLMIGHHDAHYFVLGTIGADQRADYGRRRGFNVDELNRFVPQR